MVRRAHASLGQAPLPQPASARAQTWHTHSTRHALRNYPNLPRARIPAAFLHITLCTFLHTHYLALPEGPGLIQRLPSSLPRGAITPYARNNTRARARLTHTPPLMLRPAFTAVDIATDMVAFLDDLPKVLVTRLNFSGKVEDAANWIALLRRSMKPHYSLVSIDRDGRSH